MKRSDVRLRSLLTPVDELPTEFLIFAAGVNDSTKGPALFDEVAARAVMAEYEKQGVELMIDLEHLALKNPDVTNYDPDARGWFKLALRNGALFAVNVRWTPDGAARLREKRQRYISPAFRVDENERVVELVNVAITAMPATHAATPLIAANKQLQPRTITMSKPLTDSQKQTLSKAVQSLVAEGAAPDEIKSYVETVIQMAIADAPPDDSDVEEIPADAMKRARELRIQPHELKRLSELATRDGRKLTREVVEKYARIRGPQ